MFCLLALRPLCQISFLLVFTNLSAGMLGPVTHTLAYRVCVLLFCWSVRLCRTYVAQTLYRCTHGRLSSKVVTWLESQQVAKRHPTYYRFTLTSNRNRTIATCRSMDLGSVLTENFLQSCDAVLIFTVLSPYCVRSCVPTSSGWSATWRACCLYVVARW